MDQFAGLRKTPRRALPHSLTAKSGKAASSKSSILDIKLLAGETWTGQRAVCVNPLDGKAYVAEAAANGDPVIGISLTGATADGFFTARIYGKLQITGANFTPGAPVYLLSAINALNLTHVPILDDEGAIQRIGVSLSPTELLICPEAFYPIYL